MALQAPVISIGYPVTVPGPIDGNGYMTYVTETGGHITETLKDLYRIEFRMVCADDSAGYEGLDEKYAVRYRPGDNAADKVADVMKYFQEKIDSYKRSKAIEEHANTAAAIVAIRNGLVI